MRKFTDQEFELLKRHYWVIRLFGFEWWIWNTSPQRVLEHLKELKSKNKEEPFINYDNDYDMEGND